LLDKAGVPIQPDKAREAIALIEQGQLQKEIKAAVQNVTISRTNMPASVVADLRKLPALPGNLARTIEADLAATPDLIPGVLEALRTGRWPQTVTLERTSQLLVEIATVRTIITTFRNFIAPQNEVSRLAIIIYARSKGVNLEEEDLDVLYEALRPDRIDFETLQARAFEKLVSSYGYSEAKALLVKLGSAGGLRGKKA
jgi:hypothetical protein